MTIRVIGLGNLLRGDDAAGLEVARRLAAVAGLDVRCSLPDAGAILDACDGAERVVLVDAARSGLAPGTIRRLTAGEAAAARRGGGTHDAGLADALALAEALGRPLPACAVYLIEGREFGLGEPLSSEVADAAEAVAAVLARLAEPAVTRPAPQEATIREMGRSRWDASSSASTVPPGPRRRSPGQSKKPVGAMTS